MPHQKLGVSAQVRRAVTRIVKPLFLILTDTPFRLSQYLALALSHLEEHELGHLNLCANPPSEGAALGLCNGGDARSLFYETVTSVILPELENVGLSAKKAWELRTLTRER